MTATLTADPLTASSVILDTWPDVPQIGAQVTADHPEWAHLAEDAPDDSATMTVEDLLLADERADEQGRRDEDALITLLERWENAGKQIVDVALPADGSYSPAGRKRASDMHERLMAWTSEWLPALRDDNAIAAKALEAAPETAVKAVSTAEPVTLAVAPPADDSAETGEPDAAQPDPGPDA